MTIVMPEACTLDFPDSRDDNKSRVCLSVYNLGRLDRNTNKTRKQCVHGQKSNKDIQRGACLAEAKEKLRANYYFNARLAKLPQPSLHRPFRDTARAMAKAQAQCVALKPSVFTAVDIAIVAGA